MLAVTTALQKNWWPFKIICSSSVWITGHEVRGREQNIMTCAVQIKPHYKTRFVAKISETNLGHTDVKGQTVPLTMELDTQF